MTESRLRLGADGEEAAARFLRKRGMKILERNYRTPVGEIDIIARQKTFLLFIEVKTRSSGQYGAPTEAVGPRKQRQIIHAAQWYLQQGVNPKLQPRFDVISLIKSSAGFDIEYVTNAFEA